MSAIIHGFGNNEVTCYTPGAVVWFKLCKDSSMKVRYSAHSDPGLKREVNQDWYGFSKPVQGGHKGQLLVICDGMGGHAAGEVASRLGVETILDQFGRSTEDNPAVLLEQAFSVANQQIYVQGRGAMGTLVWQHSWLIICCMWQTWVTVAPI